MACVYTSYEHIKHHAGIYTHAYNMLMHMHKKAKYTYTLHLVMGGQLNIKYPVDL